jgi:hypothetical protein
LGTSRVAFAASLYRRDEVIDMIVSREAREIEHLRAENERLRSALASVLASIHIATCRGWHHSQIGDVQEAADEAQSALPSLSESTDLDR